MEHNLTPQQLLGFPPIMDREKFAEQVGISKDSLDRMMQNGQLPEFKPGKRSFVNCVKLASQLLEGGVK